MEFLHLIKASSMVRTVLGNMASEAGEDGEILKSIEKLKADLESFNKLGLDEI